ncbi:hypothetical protein BHM03_00054752 [Ensete ventricosum]|nr:hypothetical protein BHM03_00054752 [Ensete ventricosum]
MKSDGGASSGSVAPSVAMRELCEVEDQTSANKCFTSIMMRLRCVNSVNPLVPRWSTISRSRLHFISTLIDRVHDASRLVRSQHKKILTLRAANKELKAGVGQELVAIAERRTKELEGKVEKMRTELESLKSHRRELEYRVALERLWGKHPEITIERDPFADPEDANVEMDLNQPFDDSTPSEKQPTL